LNNRRVIVSTGIGRLHLVQSALWLKRAGMDVSVVQGWIPALPAYLLNWLGRVIGHPQLVYGMLQRRPPELKGSLHSCALAEFVHQLLVRLARMGVGEHWRSARLSWRFFGWCSSRYLKNASVFHVRSGAGQGGAIVKARKRGMKIVVDHSIAHPAFMEKQLADEYQRYSEPFGMREDNPFWQLVLKDCHDADVILVNSEFVKQTFVEAGFCEKKIRVVYLGVRPDFFFLKERYDFTERIKLNQTVRLLFTGGFGFRKGAEYLLQAVKLLLIRGVKIELTVVGSYAEANTILEEFSSDHLPVTLVGHIPQDDLKGYLKESDIYVFPSLAEGCASSGMEAMAAGLCMVTTFESGLPVRDGNTGYIVPSKNAVAIADKIEWLCRNPEEVEQTGRRAAAQISSCYTWEKYAEGVAEVYEEALAL